MTKPGGLETESRVADWVYSVLLRAYPPRFRESFGAEMAQTFKSLREHTRETKGVAATLGLWFSVSWDVIGTGLAERRRNRGSWQFRNPVPSLLSDARFGLRTLRKNPGYTAGAVFTLALGIGATTTVFSQVNGLLIRPLPYAEPDRLVQLSETAPGISSMDLSFPDFRYWQQHTEVFETMFAFDDARFALASDGRTERVEGAVVSASMFSTLGVTPILGRAFLPEEDGPGTDPVVVVSHGFWVERLGFDPEVVGTSLALNGRSFTVIGVAPPNFGFPELARLWVPITLDPLLADANEYDWDAVARLKTGITLEQAAVEAAAIARQLAMASPETKGSIGAVVYPLRDADVNADARLAYAVLLASVMFVLLIACVNVANLVLARGTARQHELALRRAVGASRARIVAQLFTESGMLALLGGILGLILGVWANRIIQLSLPSEMPFWINFDLDSTVFVFVALLTMATTLVFGLLPAVEFSGNAQSHLLHSEGRGGSTNVKRRRTTNLLLVSEIALSFVLLIAATLMMRGFLNLRAAPPGFDPDGVLALGVYAPTWSYPPEERVALYEQVLQEVGTIPTVSSVSAVSELPIAGGANELVFAAEGQPLEPTAVPVANGNVVTPDYFATMRIPLTRGRDFSDGDRATSPQVTIVSESLAERYWPGENPIGRRIRLGVMGHRTPAFPEPVQWHTVVGVVGDVRQEDLTEQGSMGIYLPFAQRNSASMAVVIRTDGDPLEHVEVARSRIWQVGSGIMVFNASSMDQVLARSIWSARIFSGMLSSFAFVALALAAIGIYGVVAFSVARRTNEIGVRMAMGATRFDVLRLVLSQTSRTLVLGLALGLGGSVLLSRVLTSILYDVNPHDPAVFSCVAILLLTVGLVAAYLPARRAIRLDPAVTLRYE